MVTQTTKVGTATRLSDGRAKVGGSLRFAADLSVPGLLYAKFLPSPYAHANIRSIDKSAALTVPGVVAVLTADDLPNIAPSRRSRLLLARDRVIFVGQPVALVVATSAQIAEDALNYIHVDYEPLRAAISIEEALAPDAPLVWPNGIPSGSDDASMHGASGGGEKISSDGPSNISDHFTDDRGDIEQGFAEADVVIEHMFTSQIVHQSYIEPQSIIVQPDPMNKAVTVWTSTQGQFPVRQEVAAVLGVPEVDVRVIGTPVGGGFGGKIILYEPLVAVAALAVGRPVRLV
ncbi:MAG: xanthine dehydrogenase family protein molybdopterin-binding subunit, partial [Burkholderiales bacterium]|nr:xanthine dehydrogenase family protein molybdopterin-binding subunit [Anaerolineae bacterium]